jgi:hypothetical protein
VFATDPAPAQEQESVAGGSLISEGLLLFPVCKGERASTEADLNPPRWNLLEERRLDPTRPAKRGYRRTSDFRVSPTDPDASPMWTAGKARLGYHDHYVVDGSKRRIILAALVTPADVMENQPMLDLLWRVRFRRKLHPHQATGDTTYGTVENIVALEDAGIRAYIPLPDMNHRRPFYGQDEFSYRCGPRRVPLPGWSRAETRADQAHRGRHHLPGRCRDVQCLSAQGEVHGKQSGADCPSLPLRRLFGQGAGIPRHRGVQEAMRKRQVWVEPLFAEAKLRHGLRRFRRRGLENVNIEGLLIAAGQNLKRWLADTGWGRRHAPCGSLLALPRESGQVAAGFR